MSRAAERSAAAPLTLFVCGDVMLGRGIDQILPHPGDPRLHETYMRSALGYVELAERLNGAIPRPVDCAYIWGEALAVLARAAPDLRLINLETPVTAGGHPAPKGIHYRMHPRNVPCLTTARVDAAVLANNHALDWGPSGLSDTLEALQQAGIATIGAGRDLAAARQPRIWDLPGKRRVILLAYGHPSGGVPSTWAASAGQGGVNWLPDLSERSVELIAAQLGSVKRAGDIALVSLHWGSNWGYAVAAEQTHFAHALIDRARVDLVWGHSSHHPRPIEVYRDKLILYGCGDFLNDYEGIRGHEDYRPELVLIYLATLSPATGELQRLRLAPLRIRRFRLENAGITDARWLAQTLSHESRRFGIRLAVLEDGSLELRWAGQAGGLHGHPQP